MFAVGIAFVCFITLSAFCPRQLSFLFTYLGYGKGGLKWEREEVGKESGEGRRRAEMGIHKK